MTFDAIVGNPPYQIANGGNNASAMALLRKESHHDRTSTPQNDCCRGKHPAGV